MTEDEFRAAGLYEPASPRARERLELLEWLDSRGVTLEQMKAADAQRQLAFLASMLILRPGPYLTQQQLAERLQISSEVVDEFRVAFGIPPTAPNAEWVNDAEAELFKAVADGVSLFGGVGMLRLARVLGSSVARIAEAMATSNHERMRPIVEAGASELEIAKANLLATETAGAPARIIHGLLPLQLQIAATRLRERRTNYTALTTHGCVAFVDLVGSTSLARKVSVDELTRIVDRFEEIAYEIATNGGGRVVKFIGDEVMFVTANAASACEIALTLIERFADDAAVTPRAGLVEGEMLDRGGDYYGPVVNLAARLAELAVPREVLTSAGAAATLPEDRLKWESAGRRMIRGFDEPVALASVTRAT